jgi:hypothetical protein
LAWHSSPETTTIFLYLIVKEYHCEESRFYRDDVAISHHRVVPAKLVLYPAHRTGQAAIREQESKLIVHRRFPSANK